ncbi:ketohydroxyglutarate aldolase [Catenisphaera adipataccumulans]|uniref:2-dehydro-3-deoxyphosphogluconate aldolase/(4S)-4-hydroxy-2-oxoglutarate aldolase n=1 Tax=Catenisphaera adipataccumulans TaxID=700500 RepID=A0A7W8CZJ2_9FIRM|nr:ketohydroxyglutarate aldolase [Catenisphaera adipataccumulans]MBB5183333.1 2-dehydro-3-deoxyphosphogluconate aldolase/(4S)-4-hydroxy-2-oxoglutarate aldolase [Catenisphaera adipataccumulans]
MKKAETTLKMAKTGVMAVVRVETIERGLEIAKGCIDGGVNIMEISYTNANAGDVIRSIKEKYKDRICVGAGTVLDAATARMAIMNGAEFMVAPNFEEEVSRICNLYQVPYGPGCTTYSEGLNALKSGAAFIKAFPISNYYGPNLAKVFKVPCPQMPILASGGVNLENAKEWIKNGAEVLGVGGLLTKGDASQIEQNARQLVSLVKEARNEMAAA